ncbi:hypothetical protein AVEN_218683-1 [Araneus ventricosus]|uniref:Uncharacterized protein n=1 Tax=Araneus ventricosus TaxID=182803 RepID=A0A4Y2B4M6_ARAVE|nr:hypothetical protein AVEN_218683-1 [Araneus ventricosus]
MQCHPLSAPLLPTPAKHNPHCPPCNKRQNFPKPNQTNFVIDFATFYRSYSSGSFISFHLFTSIAFTGGIHPHFEQISHPTLSKIHPNCGFASVPGNLSNVICKGPTPQKTALVEARPFWHGEAFINEPVRFARCCRK